MFSDLVRQNNPAPDGRKNEKINAHWEGVLRKTTLCQYLTNQAISYKKTQALEVTDNIIDTPGEYVERRQFYQALSVTALGADVVLLLQDPTDMTFTLPPGLQAMFQKPLIGVITKSDLIKDEVQLTRAEKSLTLAGAVRFLKFAV